MSGWLGTTVQFKSRMTKGHTSQLIITIISLFRLNMEKSEPSTLCNTQTNSTLEIIQHAIVNYIRIYKLQETCVNEQDPWQEILVGSDFLVFSMYHIIRVKRT